MRYAKKIFSDVRKVILSQALSGLLFSIFGGQHLLIVRTTIPITIFTKGNNFELIMSQLFFETFFLDSIITSL